MILAVVNCRISTNNNPYQPIFSTLLWHSNKSTPPKLLDKHRTLFLLRIATTWWIFLRKLLKIRLSKSKRNKRRRSWLSSKSRNSWLKLCWARKTSCNSLSRLWPAILIIKLRSKKFNKSLILTATLSLLVRQKKTTSFTNLNKL